MLPDLYLDDPTGGLVPEAFGFAHSASRAERGDPTQRGEEGFMLWVSHQLSRLLAMPYAAGGYVDMAVVAESADGLRLRWDDTACSRPAWLADRVRAEAIGLTEPWVLGLDASRPPRGCVRWDAVVQDYLPCAEARPSEPHRHGSWYAEARGRDVALTLAGGAFVEPVDNAEIRMATHPCEPEELGRASTFRRVLRGHPARRTHRLR